MKYACWALLLVGACQTHDQAAPKTVVPTTTIASFCHDLSTRICAGLTGCGCRFDVRAYSASACVAVRSEACVTQFGGKIEPDIAAGHARFDDMAVGACLTAIDAMASTCELATGIGAPLPDACNAIVLSTAALEERCTLTGGGLAYCGTHAEGLCLSSADQSRCAPLPRSHEACLMGLCAEGLACNAGTCLPAGERGTTCDTNKACAQGLICAPEGTCQLPLGPGVACTEDDQCQPGLACDAQQCVALAALGDGCSGPHACGVSRSCGRAPETRVCSTPDAADMPCTDDSCAKGLICAAGDRDPTPRCVPLPGADEACINGYACVDGFTCMDGLGTCAPLPVEGETCAMGNQFCAAGLGCRSSDNTCRPGPGAGEECYLNPPEYICAAGLGCDFTDHGSLCTPLGDVGSSCTTDRTCMPETFCNYETLKCAARRTAGSTCRDGNECQADDSCVATPTGAFCQPLPALGEPCVSDCQAGLACKGPGGQCVPAFCVIPG